MKVLAIDPGNIDSAYVLWDGEKVFKFGKVSNEEMRKTLKELSLLEHGGFVVAIEMVASYGMAVGKEVFETCVAVGRYFQICEDAKVESRLVYRQEEKLHHCRSVKANDAAIRRVLMDRFGDKGTKKNPGFFFGFADDVWQAFAIGVLITDRSAGHQTAPISKILVS